MSGFSLFKPSAYQGEGKKSPYFEGWYCKLQAADGSVFALIPGLSRSREDSHSFIQVVAGGSSGYLRYPLEAFQHTPGEFDIRVGGSRFSADRILVDTELVRGEVHFVDAVPFQRRRYGLGIMGPFALAPMLECRHGVVTVASSLRGTLATPGGDICLDGGQGYIEKDWGSVFPEPYLWAQAFFEDGASLMVSAALVPVLGWRLRGLAAFLYDGRRIHRFTTYGGAQVSELTRQDSQVTLVIATSRSLLRLALHPGRDVPLKAPGSTGMAREIRESVTGKLTAILENRGRHVYEGISHAASIELCGDITRLCG